MRLSGIINKYVLIIVKRFLGGRNVCVDRLDSNMFENGFRSVNTQRHYSLPSPTKMLQTQLTHTHTQNSAPFHPIMLPFYKHT